MTTIILCSYIVQKFVRHVKAHCVVIYELFYIVTKIIKLSTFFAIVKKFALYSRWKTI